MCVRARICAGKQCVLVSRVCVCVWSFVCVCGGGGVCGLLAGVHARACKKRAS